MTPRSKSSPQLLLPTALGLALALSLGGCAAPPLEDAEPDPCAEAQAHVQACLGTTEGEFLVAATCDPDAADAVLQQSCAELAGAGKADFLGDFLCRLGLLSFCPTPVCEAPAEFDPTGSASCGELIGLETCGQCDYYLCRDAQSTSECGADSYYGGFGYYYCDRFRQVTEARLSPAGQAWSRRARTCLMESLEESVADDFQCSEVEELAFANHPTCYLETGFCSLPVTDWLLILSTIEAGDHNLRQLLTVGIGCLAQAFGPGGELEDSL